MHIRPAPKAARGVVIDITIVKSTGGKKDEKGQALLSCWSQLGEMWGEYLGPYNRV